MVQPTLSDHPATPSASVQTKLRHTIARFDPIPALGEAVCDNHYRNVHIPLARRMLGSVPTIRRYSTLKVTACYDAAGGWNLTPKAWRFATQIFDDGAVADGDAATAFPTIVRETLAKDHRNCLCRLRRFDVEQTTLLDSFTDQRIAQTYLFEYERDDTQSPDEARAAFRDLADTALDALAAEPGLRQMVRSTVTAEAETRALDEPGQLLTGKSLNSTATAGYLQIVFDHSSFARKALSQETIRQVLQSPAFATATGYELVEEVGFDKR